MEKYSFSIIIPTLNEERNLPNLLKELSEQTFNDFELIVVDGLSDDKTLVKANSFKDKFLMGVEKYTGWRIGEYKNYKIV